MGDHVTERKISADFSGTSTLIDTCVSISVQHKTLVAKEFPTRSCRICGAQRLVGSVGRRKESKSSCAGKSFVRRYTEAVSVGCNAKNDLGSEIEQEWSIKRELEREKIILPG